MQRGKIAARKLKAEDPGTEEYWDNPEGAEAILHVRAALLSDDERLADYIDSRPGSAFRSHPTNELAQAA